MCKYTQHRMKCGHAVLKTNPCPLSIPDEQGKVACPRGGVHPYIESMDVRNNIENLTYGPGVCARINCRIGFGLLPHDYNEKYWMLYLPDEEPFDMSPAARAESERRWLAQMSPAQRQMVIHSENTVEEFRCNLLAPDMRFAVNTADLGKVEAFHLVHFFKANGKFPEPYVPQWWALNPRYMTAFQLYQYTPGFLDVDVANPGAETRGPVAQCPAVMSLLAGQDDIQSTLDFASLMFWCAEQAIEKCGLKKYDECDAESLEWINSWLPDWEQANGVGVDHKHATVDEQGVMYDAEEDRDDHTNDSSETEPAMLGEETDTLFEEGSDDENFHALFEEDSDIENVFHQSLQILSQPGVANTSDQEMQG